MSNYEINASAFEEICKEITKNPISNLSESDTRAKIIDQILVKALDWSETGKNIIREEHVHEGYIDYTLQAGGNHLIVEAKKEGVSFSLPETFTYEKHLSVKNLLQKQTDLKLMYDQVTKYAWERSISICVLTNGYQWIIFPGVRADNIHIRNSKVVVFNGLENIKNNFLEFWKLLSFGQVEKDALSKAILETASPIEPTYIFNSEGRVNIPFDRNPLSPCLINLLPKYFGDLHGDPTQTEMLKECFVSDVPIQDAMTELGFKQDDVPSKTIAEGEPIKYFYSLPQVSRQFEVVINSFLSDRHDKFVQVLLGRVGIGKTTFLTHFFDLQRRDLSEKHFTLRLDFQDVSDGTDLEKFFIEKLWDMLIGHRLFSALTVQSTLEKIFEKDIKAFLMGPIAWVKKSDPQTFELEQAKYLSSLYSDKESFLKKLATFLYKENFARFILVFDNVDQLDLPLQDKVIRFAYSKIGEYHAFGILIMWEETYYFSKKSGKVLSTIRTVPIQLVKQSTAAVLVKRLKYLIRQIESGKESLSLLESSVCDRQTFCGFIDLILRSLLVDNKRVRTFLEIVALGNIRSALEIFHAFLTAGSLETTKIIECMRTNDRYLVPPHEFIKSIMLGSKRYYSERTSNILNVFAIGDAEKPCHFTRLRILQWLHERRHETTLFGKGFKTISETHTYFNQFGISKKDIDVSLSRLNDFALIENDLRSQKFLTSSQAVRITATGRYYLNDLYRQFAYVDLAMQDTPFFDHEVFKSIASDCESVDMNDRFRRVDSFLQYLQDQEEEELITIEKLGKEVTWRRRFVPNIKSTYEATKRFIISKGYAD